MSYIYLYTHTHTHSYTHTDMRAHTLVQTSQFTLLLCMRAPECESLYSNRYRPPACTNTHTHTLKTHTHTHESRTDIFSHCTAVLLIKALPQIFALLFYLFLLVSLRLTHKHRRQASAWIVLIVFPRSVPLLSSPKNDK